MSILKKINFFGSGESRKHVMRQVRVPIKELHKVKFTLLDASSPRIIRVGNVSSSGLGLLREDLSEAKKDLQLHGKLLLDQRGFELQAVVKHLSEKIIGCQFMGVPADLAKALDDYFRIEIMGLSLNPVDEKFLKQESDGKPIWFTDGGNNELFFVVSPEGLVKRFHLTFMGNYIEGIKDKRVRGGTIVDKDDHNDRAKAKGSAMVSLNEVIAPEMIKLAEQLIINVGKLEISQREQLLTFLQKT